MQRYAYAGRSILQRTRARRHRPLATGAGLIVLVAVAAVVALSREPAAPMPGAPTFDVTAIYPHEETVARAAPVTIALQASAPVRKVRPSPGIAAGVAAPAQEPAAAATTADGEPGPASTPPAAAPAVEAQPA